MTWILQITAWCAVVFVANAVPLLFLAAGAPLRSAAKLAGNVSLQYTSNVPLIDP